MKKKTEQNAAGAPQTGKTAGAGAAGFLKKNWKWLVPVACVAVLGGVWLLKPKADKPASVDTSYVETAPEQRDLVNALSGTGTLKPANTYNVKSLVSGKVLTSTFEEGDVVEEGHRALHGGLLRRHHQGRAGGHHPAAGPAQLRQDGGPPVCARGSGRCREQPERSPRATR